LVTVITRIVIVGYIVISTVSCSLFTRWLGDKNGILPAEIPIPLIVKVLWGNQPAQVQLDNNLKQKR